MSDLSCVEESIFYPVGRKVESQSKSYTLAEIEQLAREYKTVEIDMLNIDDDERLAMDLTISNFIAWLKRREKEGGR